jgi:hypothetical protein
MLKRRVLVLLGKTIGALAIIAALVTGCQPSNSGGGYAAPTETVGLAATKPCHARHVDEADPQAWLPDSHCTPGKANPAVTIGQICPQLSGGFARPPTDYTNQLKEHQLRYEYDYTDSAGSHTYTAGTTEEDHLISRALGGDLSAKENLWPEPHASYNEKDKVEAAAHAAVCRGSLTLPQAQQSMAFNWIEFGKRLGVKFDRSP